MVGRLIILVLASTMAVFVAATVAVGANSAHASGRVLTCTSPPRWRGIHASNYKINCIVCKTFGPQAVAKDNGIRSTDKVTIALLYARKAYRPPFRQAVFEGCRQGFLIWSKPLFRYTAMRHPSSGLTSPECTRLVRLTPCGWRAY